MPNSIRHVIGLVAGVVLTPVIAACLMYGSSEIGRSLRTFGGEGAGTPALVLIAGAVLIGLVAGTRVSPLASLVPGAVFGGIGLVWAFAPRWAYEHLDHDLHSRLDTGYLNLVATGAFLALGVVLVAASIAPSRWRARPRAAAAPAFGGPPPAPMGPPPGQNPGWHPPAPPPSAPPQPSAPQPVRHDADDDEPGEWTRRYGGGNS
ncbi:hypothetical protein [Spirillospora albida]|uniref:hypothetical protein n=1 Tax=Spirillospora albida TaxID=58123 RepID=UPI0004C03DD0|nr:hypothetical protein [Spirillospora albida]